MTDVHLREILQGPRCHKRRFYLESELAEKGNGGTSLVQCPVCGIYAPELQFPQHEASDQLAIERVQADFPGWEPEEGACETCLSRYRRAVQQHLD